MIFECLESKCFNDTDMMEKCVIMHQQKLTCIQGKENLLQVIVKGNE